MKLKIYLILSFTLLWPELFGSENVAVEITNHGLVSDMLSFHEDPQRPLSVDGPLNQEMDSIKFSENEKQFESRDKALFKNEDEYEQEVARLMSLPEMYIPIKDASLHAAIKLCAEASSMNYIAPDEDLFSGKITLNIKSNPYILLKLLEERYDLGMKYEYGVWHFYKMNWNELITRQYKLKFNNLVVVRSTPPTLSTNLGSKSSFEYGSSSTTSVGEAFQISSDKIINDLKHELLMIPTVSGGADSNADTHGSMPSVNARHGGIHAPEPRILYNEDTNELLVSATRQQHLHVKQYLETIDQPQKLIRIDSKFVETTRDPQSELGIDWSMVSDSTIKLSGITGDLKKGEFPKSVILSFSDMMAQLRFLSTDTKSKIVQDPNVVTVNNKSVSLKSVILEPVETSSFDNVSSNANNVISTKLEYLEIGTIINVFPQIMEGGIAEYEGDAVKLTVSITVSSIISERRINGKTAPSIASRTYDYTVIVPNKHTLVIGGLTEFNDTETEVGIIGLRKIPLLGSVLRSKKKRKLRRTLVAYITPSIINGNSEEIMQNNE